MQQISTLFTNTGLSKEAINILENFDQIVQGVRPLNSKQLQQLPENIRSLSHQLTDRRSERRLGYMNENVQLSSYVRYYTWWNLVRLTRLFSNLPPESFPCQTAAAPLTDVKSGKTNTAPETNAKLGQPVAVPETNAKLGQPTSPSDIIPCLDLGSGPLTVITALWLARPELRKKKLKWYCLDVSANSMSLGEDIFLSIAAKTSEEPWRIIRVKGSFGTFIKEKCSFITCANMFNELDQASDMPPEFQSKKYYEQLRNYASGDAKVLLVEPGVPKAARTLSLLRERFIKDGKTIVAPCTHCESCPMNGFKSYTGSKHKWCNFAFSTEDAPQKLLKLSTLAKLPKERATLSFISIGDEKKAPKASVRAPVPAVYSARVISDGFRLPGNRTGYYACTKLGLTLLSAKQDQTLASGDLITVEVKTKTPDLPIDEKSGAVVIRL